MLDGAHNPDAVSALVESLPELLDTPAGTRPLALVMGVLEDKDAVSMLRQLLPLCVRAWFTAPPSSRALSPAALESLARQLGFEAVTCEPRPRRALALAQAWARSHDGGPPAPAVLATGSVYLVGDLLAADAEPAGPAQTHAARTAAAGAAMSEDGPSVLAMIGAVALIVALVILIFFAAGYGFGRLFL